MAASKSSTRRPDSALGSLMPSKALWLQTCLSPDCFRGSWAEPLASGWRLRQRDNVLFLTYEEMKRDLPAAVRRIAALMNVTLSPAQFNEVVRQSSFAHMKQIGMKFDMSRFKRPRRLASGAMIRRGESGVADELLSADEQRRVDQYWRAELARLDCDFPYDQVFARSADGLDTPRAIGHR